jgi:fumarate reductase flavoprotein subunit
MLPSEPDVVILGAGAAGMFVALAAQARGLQVLIADPMADQANNFAISGGLFPAAGSALQRAAGIDDRPQAWLDDLRRQAPAGTVNERIATAVAQALPEVVDFLAGPAGLPVRFLAGMVAPGHAAQRFHSVEPASGAAFHAALRAALRRPGVVFLPERLSPVRTDSGFVCTRASGSRVQTSQLVLAGGGFGADAAMVARYIPAMAGALNNGSATNDGSMIALGLAWGAQVWGMDGFQGQAHTHPGGATRLGMGIPSLGGVMVNRSGRRFAREDLGPSALAPHVLAQPEGLALEVFDAAIEARLDQHSAYQQARAAGRVLEAADLAELAAKAGVDPGGLARTLDEVARWARGEGQDPLGRARFERVLQPPYRASWVTGALSHTQGGLLTDEHGAVLDAGGAAIDGLYAAGGTAAGLAGRGAEGYLPGNGLAQAFGLGWRIAQGLCDSLSPSSRQKSPPRA